MHALPTNWKPIPRRFFESPPETVAPRLLGKLLARRTAEGWLGGRIVEVEAYFGPHSAIADPAAHSFRGVTARNAVMFGPAGHAYVYFIYGMHYCVNVTCEPEGLAGCILIRALEPAFGQAAMARNRKLAANSAGAKLMDAKLTGGPGRLCQALKITRSEDNGVDLVDASSPLQLREDVSRSGPERSEIEVTPRIGIRHAADLPLRFALAGNACVSGPRRSKIPV